MKQLYLVAAACLSLTAILALTPLTIGTASAHHTYVTKYNPDKLVTLKGTVASVDFRNPHIFFQVAVTNRDGNTTTWSIETEGISKVQAKGLTEAKLAPGTLLSATGWMARDGTAQMGLKSIRIGSHTYTIRKTPR